MVKIIVWALFLLFQIGLFFQMYYLESIIEKEKDKNLLDFEKDNIINAELIYFILWVIDFICLVCLILFFYLF